MSKLMRVGRQITKLIFLALLTLVVSIILWVILQEIGLKTAPLYVPILEGNYLEAIFESFIYSIISIGWLYLLGLLVFYVFTKNQTRRFQYLSGLVIPLILVFAINFFFRGSSPGINEILLEAISSSISGVFAVLLYRNLFFSKGQNN